MTQALVHLGYAPRGPGLMCALFCFAQESNVYGWYTGARANEFLASFFMLEHFYSTHATAFYRTHVTDVYADWFLEFPPVEQKLEPPVPVPEPICHELERLQFVFTQEWLYYRDDPKAGQQIAAYHDMGLPVHNVNIKTQHLNKLDKNEPVWTHSSPGFDLNVLEYLGGTWQIDYRSE